jgi:hypothetical protein
MKLKQIIDKLLAVLYAVFSLLMFSAAVSSFIQQMIIGAVVFVCMGSGSAYLAIRRWRGTAGTSGQIKETGDQDSAEASLGDGAEGRRKPVRKTVGRILIACIIVVIAGWMGSILVESRSNIRYMESSSAALIDTLEKYRKEKGVYPDNLKQLQPAYITELPVCRRGSSQHVSYTKDNDQDAYYLNCYTGFYTEKRRYSSQTRKWASWD